MLQLLLLLLRAARPAGTPNPIAGPPAADASSARRVYISANKRRQTRRALARAAARRRM